jgi:hypothetical protein
MILSHNIRGDNPPGFLGELMMLQVITNISRHTATTPHMPTVINMHAIEYVLIFTGHIRKVFIDDDHCSYKDGEDSSSIYTAMHMPQPAT